MFRGDDGASVRVRVACVSILTQPLARTLTLTLTLTPTTALSAGPHRMLSETIPALATAANVLAAHSRSQRCVGWPHWIRDPRDLMSGGYTTFAPIRHLSDTYTATMVRVTRQFTRSTGVTAAMRE